MLVDEELIVLHAGFATATKWKHRIISYIKINAGKLKICAAVGAKETLVRLQMGTDAPAGDEEVIVLDAETVNILVQDESSDVFLLFLKDKKNRLLI